MAGHSLPARGRPGSSRRGNGGRRAAVHGTICSVRRNHRMSDRVKEILSWYGSDNPGTLTNLARLLNSGTLAGTGRLVIMPVVQGVEHGPARSFAVNHAAYDPRYNVELAIEAGCND